MSTPEEIRYDGQQQDREDKRREMLERRGRTGGPDAPEACEKCEGTGRVLRVKDTSLHSGYSVSGRPLSRECPRCLGTGVQP